MHRNDFRSPPARGRRPLVWIVVLMGLALGIALAGQRSAATEDGTAAAPKPAEGEVKTQEAGKEAAKAAKPGKGDGWEAPAEAKKTSNPIAAGPESIARGEQIYAKACASCHGATGKGDGKSAKILAKKPADLREHVPHHTDGELFWKITEGKKPMPSFKKDLKAEQRWDVVNYLRKMTVPAAAAADSAKKAPPGGAKAAQAEPGHEGHGH